MRPRTITLTVVALLAIGAMASTGEAAPLPTGSWGCGVNGFGGNFVVGGVSGAGVLTATFLGSPVIGGYDSNTNRITFIRQGGGDRSTDQTYVGYLFSLANVPNPGQTEFVLSGYFIGFPGSGATAARPEYGWACALIQ
jgi:hypothetical protein